MRGKITLTGEDGKEIELDADSIEITMQINDNFTPAVTRLTGDDYKRMYRTGGWIERCPVTCITCGNERCVGNEPHADNFGPFHVFPQHICS